MARLCLLSIRGRRLNSQQLRAVRETVLHGFNLTDVAQAVHTSQPGISRQIRELEAELGFELFVRAGKRLTGLTVPGQRSGQLTIAATHSQARYALPHAVFDFRC